MEGLHIEGRVHLVQFDGEGLEVFREDVLPHPAVDGTSQYGTESGTDEAQNGQHLEEMLEGDDTGDVHRERDVQDDVTGSAQQGRDVEPFDVHVRVDEEVHEALVAHNQGKSQKDGHFVSSVQADMPLVGKDASQHCSSQVPPVQRDVVQYVVLQDAVCEDVLQDGRGRQKKAEHQEQEEQGREVAVLEGFQGDVRMPADNHPVDAEGQREDGNQRTKENLYGVEPVVELAIFEHEDDGQQEDGP